MNDNARHRLDGLEPDNLLAFLALLGLLRALETARPEWLPRAGWDLDCPPLRPFLTTASPATTEDICAAAAQGVETLMSGIDFGALADLKATVPAARDLLVRASDRVGDAPGRYFADLCAALLSDAAIDREGTKVDPTPLAYPSVATSNFLRNAIELCRHPMPEKRARDPSYPGSPTECIAQALFAPWQRRDRPVGLRWDPDEAKRHAYRWRAPTKDAPTTQHGANRLAIVGLSVLITVPSRIGSRVQLGVAGGDGIGDRFTLAWPIWQVPTSLAAIRALLTHPDLRAPGRLARLGVDHIRVARRISLDRLRNFAYAEAVTEAL